MKLGLCGMVLAFATFAHIETKPNIEEPSEHHIHPRGLDDVNVPFSSPIFPDELERGTKVGTVYLLDADEQEDFKTFDVTIDGKYYWERIYYYDNRGQSNTYRETRKVTKKISTSYSELAKSVYDASVKIYNSIEVGGKFEIISLSVKNSIDVQLSTSYQKTVERKSTTEITEELTREFVVGPDSIGELFRLNYKGPGVHYATDTISTNGSIPLDKVFVECRVRPVPLIREIRVVRTSQSIDRPENLITETSGGNPDINAGFSGDYVWLVPVWTLKKDRAVTGIQIVIQWESNDAYTDMAAEAGGQYRYLKMLREPFSNTRISRVILLRSADYIYGDRERYGWDECTDDINRDRDGDFLHLCWNTVSVSYSF